jgi:hypothetical protein
MSGQVIPDGTGTVMGPGGHLTVPGDIGPVLLPPEEGNTQQWAVAFGSGTSTLQNVATSPCLGRDGDPNEPDMMIGGTSRPFTWQLSAGSTPPARSISQTPLSTHSNATNPSRTSAELR